MKGCKLSKDCPLCLNNTYMSIPIQSYMNTNIFVCVFFQMYPTSPYISKRKHRSLIWTQCSGQLGSENDQAIRRQKWFLKLIWLCAMIAKCSRITETTRYEHNFSLLWISGSELNLAIGVTKCSNPILSSTRYTKLYMNIKTD